MIEEVVETENEQNESSSPAPSGESRVQAEREGHSREAIRSEEHTSELQSQD